jgi:hypothetical protein
VAITLLLELLNNVHSYLKINNINKEKEGVKEGGGKENKD